MIRPGTTVIKTTSGRRAQVTAITPTHAIVYWPDKDENTMVRLERFNRTAEWRVHDPTGYTH
jgi:hypothetical protein